MESTAHFPRETAEGKLAQSRAYLDERKRQTAEQTQGGYPERTRPEIDPAMLPKQSNPADAELVKLYGCKISELQDALRNRESHIHNLELQVDDLKRLNEAYYAELHPEDAEENSED